MHDRFLLIIDDRDRNIFCFYFIDPLHQKIYDLFGCTAAKIFITANNYFVKEGSGYSSKFPNIFIPSIACAADDAYFGFSFHLTYKINKQVKSGRVMCKVGQEFEMPELKKVQSSGGLRSRRHKGLQCQFDILDADISPEISSQHGWQTVHHIVHRFSTIGYRHIGDLDHADLPGAFHYADVAIFKHRRIAAFFAMLNYPGVIFIHAEQCDIAFKALLHCIHQVVFSI